MPSGVTVEGLSGLRALLLDQPEQFVGTVTKKAAWPTPSGVSSITTTSRPCARSSGTPAAEEYRWSSLILGIVKSPAFLMRNAQTADRRPWVARGWMAPHSTGSLRVRPGSDDEETTDQ